MSENPAVAQQTADGDLARWPLRLWAILVVVCGALFLDGLDSAMIGVAVPSIQREFLVGASSVQWVISAYVLGFGGFLMFAGRLADRLGRRRVLIVGVAVLMVASLAGGLAGSITWVIAARFGMGVGAALTAPAGLAIIATSFREGPQRNRAVGIYTVCGAVGFSAGLIGGGLLSNLGWRWVFVLSVVMAAAVWLGTALVVPRDPVAEGAQRRLDLPGSLTITGAMLVLVYLIVDAPTAGGASARTWALGGVVVLLLLLFWWIERSTADPLFDPKLLANGDLLSAALFCAAIMGTYTSFQFISALYLQQNRGWSPLQMALGFLPLSILVALIGPRVGTLIGRIGARRVIALGFVLYVVAYLLFLRIGVTSSYWAVVLPTVVLIGVAFPLSFAGAYVQATTGVASDQQGFASSVAQTGYQLGSAVVLAVVTLMIAIRTGAGRPASVADYRQGMFIVCGVAITALAFSLMRVFREKSGAAMWASWRSPRRAAAEQARS